MSLGNLNPILAGGALAVEGVKGWIDSTNNSSGSSDQAAGLLGAAGVLAGILDNESPFLSSLSRATGGQLGMLGLALGSIQLNDAIGEYREALNGSDAAAQQAAYENLADKTAGLVAGLGGVIAAIPGLGPLGGAMWLGGTLAQQVTNGNFGRLSEFVQGELPGAVSSILGTTPDPLVKTIQYVDPLVLDLDGDGLQVTQLTRGVMFDANNDGIKTGTAWAGSNEGILVWDRNGNGVIDSGRELFGDETVLSNGSKAVHGFEALRELDTGTLENGEFVGKSDNVFDAKDQTFANLRLWRDSNQDGISQASELFTLQESGVASIDLLSTADSKNYGDAILAQSGSFTRVDGSSGQAGSFIFAQNSFARQFANISLSEESRSLPNFKGSGWVRDLQEAASIEPKIIELFNAAKNADSRSEYKYSIGNLLLNWGLNSEHTSAAKKAAAEGYGLILSEPVDGQEALWMDIAIKSSSDSRDVFRSTLTASDLQKFDAMRERMVGGLEKVFAYEAFTGHTFLTWSQIHSDAVDYKPRWSTSGVVPVEVSVPLSLIILQNQNGFVSSQPGYVRVNIPAPSSGLPHVDTLWDRLVSDVSDNFITSVRLSKYLDLVFPANSNGEIKLDFSALNSALESKSVESMQEGAALTIDLFRAHGVLLQSLGWKGAEKNK